MPNSPKATWVPAKRVANDSPLWYLAAPFLLFLVSAGMGEWKTINNVLSGLPKAITLGIIALAVAYAFIRPILSVCGFLQRRPPYTFLLWRRFFAGQRSYGS